ncbi:hypothetical protein, partial [Streptomyces sp. NPDC006875]|uniref:hypothetical protein n=1 Tax=Streptomyces sp. NPDC006875 TaxID=3154781 RepID=UPI0033CE173A
LQQEDAIRDINPGVWFSEVCSSDLRAGAAPSASPAPPQPISERRDGVGPSVVSVLSVVTIAPPT